MSTYRKKATPHKLNRRTFLHTLAAVGALAVAEPAVAAGEHDGLTSELAAASNDVVEVSIAELQARMAAHKLTARELVLKYVARINQLDQAGPSVHAVLEVNPDVLAIADALDAERRKQGARGPLHGIPILLKDNIDTADRMLTTAGSLDLVGTRPTQDAKVAQRLREAGAILLGKTNLSEWAGSRSIMALSGWSGRGGQCKNPYVLDRSPSGSSAGSAAAVSASFAAAALGTETDGSIVDPASVCGVVGIKPTVGLTSRAGVIPIAGSQDTVGVHGRSVADAAAVLGALVGVDPRDAVTAESAGKFFTDYTRFLDPQGLRGARIGVARAVYFGNDPATDRVINAAIAIMRRMGATIVDPADIPTAQAIHDTTAEVMVLLYEFKAQINRYLKTCQPNPLYPNAPKAASLDQLIAYNNTLHDVEMPYFGQDLFEMAAQMGSLTGEQYLAAKAEERRLSREEGIDAVMNRYQLDALVAPTSVPAWTIASAADARFLRASSSPAAMAGYPLINVPAGAVNGLPVGITFMGRAYSEPTLIKLAYAFERASKFRRAPRFIRSIGE